MITGHRMLLALLTCAAIVVTSLGAVAQTTTGAQSPEEIGRQLKSRGLPIGAEQAQPNSAGSPDNVRAIPLVAAPPKSGSRGVPSMASPLQPTPAAHPSVTLEAIAFEFGSAQLKPESIQELRNLGIALNQLTMAEAKLLIEGHTDKKGTASYNLELSKRRADAVKDYLVKEMGVSADRLETVGKGFSEPVNPRDPYAPENRRVVVVNIGAS